jgi:hemolysin III
MIAAPQLIRGLESPAIVMLVLGGVLYTAGAIVFALKRPDPRPLVFGYHEIWHSFMVAASACHFVLVLLVVTR